MGRLSILAALLAALLSHTSAGRAAADETVSPRGITFVVRFDDPTGHWTQYHERIRAAINSAGAEWAKYLDGNASIEIEVTFHDSLPNAMAQAQSLGRSHLGPFNSSQVWEPGVATKIRTGIDVNGSEPDARIGISTEWLVKAYWFDPNPGNSQTALPPDKIDAHSIFLHEIGHAIAFDTHRDWQTGKLSPNAMTPYDKFVEMDATGMYFAGPKAMAEYGGDRVPLAWLDCVHLSHQNNTQTVGATLYYPATPVMAGYGGSEYGLRLNLTPLDVAIAADCGLKVKAIPPLTRTRINVNPTQAAMVMPNTPSVTAPPSPFRFPAVQFSVLVAAGLTLAVLIAGIWWMIWMLSAGTNTKE